MGIFGSKSPREIIKQEAKSEADLRILITEACKQGAVLSKLYFDAHGKDKEMVENALAEFIGRLSKEKGVLLAKGEIGRAIEEKELYSAYATVDVLTESFNALVTVSLKYAPLGVEIIEPTKVALTLEQAHGILMDCSRVVHQYTQFITEKTMSTADKIKLNEQLKRRAQLAAKLREDSEKGKEPGEV